MDAFWGQVNKKKILSYHLLPTPGGRCFFVEGGHSIRSAGQKRSKKFPLHSLLMEVTQSLLCIWKKISEY